MCGIIGLYAPDIKSRELVGKAISLLHHRGPDAAGLISERVGLNTVTLGHTRLSIIDLSSKSKQPMISFDGNYILVFNGEIYNYIEIKSELITHGYVFETHSDTEVLLYSWMHWGKECLKKFRGMFSFVIFNKINNTLTLARDAFGIKPAYYFNNGKEIGFSSEINSLLHLYTDNLKVNLQTSYNYLVWGKYDNSIQTFFENIFQLMPGHLIVFDFNSLSDATAEQWWWPSIVEKSNISFSDASDKLREMFLENIRMHLRSDVPVGAALSGGLDSSSIVCAMRYVEPDLSVDTFSYIAKGSSFDEEHWIDIVNNYAGARPHKISIDSDNLIQDIDKMIFSQGEPFGSTSIYAQYRLYSLVRDAGIKVTLDGQGADEMLAGYLGFPGYRMASLLDSGQYVKLLKFLNEWSKWPGRSLSVGLMALIEQIIPDNLRSMALRSIGQSPTPCWINKAYFHANNINLKYDFIELPADSRNRNLMNVLRYRLTTDGLGCLLRHGDRNSMCFSIESRVPFLTIDFSEFILGLPEDYLISSHGETKHIFRSAMRGIVPNEVLNRKDKVGFTTPEFLWLSNSMDEMKKWILIAHDIPFLNYKDINNELEKSIKNGKLKNGYVWRIINYCRWYKMYHDLNKLEF